MILAVLALVCGVVLVLVEPARWSDILGGFYLGAAAVWIVREIGARRP